ncbi:Mob1/phocein [Phlebopus sp. FC_14]|nr:Mob1/phocein [Phlebopus sp. FC_14]
MLVAIQRPFRGSRVSSFYPVKSVPPLSCLESAFQLQEYISLLIRLDVHDVDAIVSLPGKPGSQENDDKTLDSTENDSKTGDDGERKSEIVVDRACWIYEQLRRLAQDLSHPLITMLQQECTRSSCPQMKAGEWLYLCVAHGNDGAMEQCCAIDYILHTLDSATALLNSPRAFPSRMSIPQTSYKHFSSLARRLGRIFAHAYFQHREVFQQAEAESSLYARFLKLTTQFDLIPSDFLVIPEHAMHPDRVGCEDVEPPRLLAAAVHPSKNLYGNEITADRPHTANSVNVPGRSQLGIMNSPVGTDSPRRLGRNRTDTMVFSEAYSVAEELVKSELSVEAGNSSFLDVTQATDPDTDSQSFSETDMGPEVHAEERPATASTSPVEFISRQSPVTSAQNESPVADSPPEYVEPPGAEAPSSETPPVQEAEHEESRPTEPTAEQCPISESTREFAEESSTGDEDIHMQERQVEVLEPTEPSSEKLSRTSEDVSQEPASVDNAIIGQLEELRPPSEVPMSEQTPLGVGVVPTPEQVPPENDIADEACESDSEHGQGDEVAGE